MYFTPPHHSTSTQGQNVHPNFELAKKQEGKGKQKVIDSSFSSGENVNDSQISFHLPTLFQQPSTSTIPTLTSTSSLTTFEHFFTPKNHLAQLSNHSSSKTSERNPISLQRSSSDALIKAKQLLKKSDITWKEIYTKRQKERMMNSSCSSTSTNEDLHLSSENDIQTNSQFPLDAGYQPSDSGQSQSQVLSNPLDQFTVFHTPPQSGPAALLNMTESIDISSTALQPENSNQAYKPTKMYFCDPFASDRAGKEIQATKLAIELQDQKATFHMQSEGNQGDQEDYFVNNNTSKRAYSSNPTNDSPDEDTMGKREKRTEESENHQIEAEKETENVSNEELSMNNTIASPPSQRVRKPSMRGKNNRSTAGGQRRSLRSRTAKSKESSTELIGTKGEGQSFPDQRSIQTSEKGSVHYSSELDTSDIESKKAQMAIGELMRQQQLWQNVVSKLRYWLWACNLKVLHIGLQLEEAQKDTIEKQRMQQFQEVEELVRQDMALSMQQAPTSQPWLQASVPQVNPQISSLTSQTTFVPESTSWIFNQPVFGTQATSSWPNQVQNTSLSMPSSDSTDSTLASQYLEYAPGQFQQIRKSYITPEAGNSNMENMHVNVKLPTDTNTSSSSEAPSILPVTNQEVQYIFTAEEKKEQPENKIASPSASRSNVQLTSASNASLVPSHQNTIPSNPSLNRVRSVTNRNAKMTPPTAPKGSSAPVKDLHYILTDYGSSGEVTWKLDDNEQAQRLAAKFYLPGHSPFPIRPLHEGVLRKIHDEWLQTHSLSSDILRSGGHGFSTTYQGAEGARKFFPQVETNPDAAYLRQVWQELDRRRILNLANFPDVIEHLRKEASDELKREASQRAMMSATMMNALTWANIATQEPPGIEIDQRARMNWERRKAAAAYAVGLLRQAEYCIAEGFRAFALGNPVVPEKDLIKEAATTTNSQDTVLQPSTNQNRHHREKHGKKGEVSSNVYSATLPHGGTNSGSGSDAVLGSPSILANATLSPEAIAQANFIPPERKSSNDNWDATMMRRIGSK